MRGKQSHSQDVTEITRYCSPKTRQSVTGAVFVDLSAAYDTMNHRILITKIYQMTNDKAMTTLLGNRTGKKVDGGNNKMASLKAVF